MGNLEILVGTTKGAFLISGGRARSGWAVNHVTGDSETGTICAGG